MMKKLILITILFANLFISCSDDNDDVTDDSLWEITLTTNIKEDKTRVELQVQGVKSIDWDNGSKATYKNSTTYSTLYNTGTYTITIKGQGKAVLVCDMSHLTSLDVSKCPHLAQLYCIDNQLTEIDLSNCTQLSALYCQNNQLETLDISKCTALHELYCDMNLLSSVNMGDITGLRNFVCNENQLTAIDLSSCQNLVELGCAGNQLTSLDLSQCKKLVDLVCIENQITSLDVSQCRNISNIFCRDNAFTTEYMNAFFHSLPDRNDKNAGILILHYDKSIGDVTIAEDKNWTVE